MEDDGDVELLYGSLYRDAAGEEADALQNVAGSEQMGGRGFNRWMLWRASSDGQRGIMRA